MPNVTNADLHKLLLTLQDNLNKRCDGLENSNKTLVSKIDGFGHRLDEFEQRLDNVDETHLAHSQKFKEIEDRMHAKVTEGLAAAEHRIATLEKQLHNLQNVEIPEQVRQLRAENDKLREELESRTNRQLRRTLVFKNIPETKNDESYQEVKALLAETISSITDISKEEAFNGIERAHREANREGGNRQGKRKIFAAFLNWELPQKIIDQFRKKSIQDRTFELYAEQMYGPLTSLRRNLAFQKRKELKAKGEIVSGFVKFPAKLMVNAPGDVDRYGRKVYKQHTDFSFLKVEKF